MHWVRTGNTTKDRHNGLSEETVTFPLAFSHICTYGCALEGAKATAAIRSKQREAIDSREESGSLVVMADGDGTTWYRLTDTPPGGIAAPVRKLIDGLRNSIEIGQHG